MRYLKFEILNILIIGTLINLLYATEIIADSHANCEDSLLRNMILKIENNIMFFYNSFYELTHDSSRKTSLSSQNTENDSICQSSNYSRASSTEDGSVSSISSIASLNFDDFISEENLYIGTKSKINLGASPKEKDSNNSRENPKEKEHEKNSNFSLKIKDIRTCIEKQTSISNNLHDFLLLINPLYHIILDKHLQKNESIKLLLKAIQTLDRAYIYADALDIDPETNDYKYFDGFIGRIQNIFKTYFTQKDEIQVNNKLNMIKTHFSSLSSAEQNTNKNSIIKNIHLLLQGIVVLFEESEKKHMNKCCGLNKVKKITKNLKNEFKKIKHLTKNSKKNKDYEKILHRIKSFTWILGISEQANESIFNTIKSMEPMINVVIATANSVKNLVPQSDVDEEFFKQMSKQKNKVLDKNLKSRIEALNRYLDNIEKTIEDGKY